MDNIEIIKGFSYNICNIKADLITSRAVCESLVLIQGSKHLLLNGGYYLFFKGANTYTESTLLKNFQCQTFSFPQRTFIYARDKS